MEPDPDEQQHPGLEDLEWGDETVKDKKLKGLYSKTSEKARGFISTEKQCALFCGGKKCKYCLPEGWNETETAIKGLYSHWVTDNILAMARPSNMAIKKYNIIQQFLHEDIKSIVNLQTKGEHADCGPEKLDESGFLYNPQNFMDQGIFFYNFGWPDYGVASLSTILDMVKVMQFAVSQGKVAIHCHAGRGRTGVIIACYLVFTNRISGIEAIHYVRDKRPSSIQTRQQMQVIQEFEQYLKPFRTVFASRQPGSHEFSLQQFLNRQRHILHGYEARRLKYVPKIVYVVCERLLELAKKGSSLRGPSHESSSELAKTYQSKTNCMNIDKNNSVPVTKSHSKDSLSMVSSKKKRYKVSLLATRTRNKSISMEDLEDERFKAVLDDSDRDKISVGSSGGSLSSGTVRASGTSDAEADDDDDDSIVFGNSTVNLRADTEDRVNGETSNGEVRRQRDGAGRLLDNVSLQSDMTGWSIDQSISGQLSEEFTQKVAQALSAKDLEGYVEERAEVYETQLNQTEAAWLSLSSEGDPYVLAQILWDWLDQLKEPVLRAQDLQILLPHVEEPDEGLRKVEKGTKSTIEYLVKFVGKLSPVSEVTLMNMYEKLLSHLTHCLVILEEEVDVTKSWAMSTISSLAEEKEHWEKMRPDLAARLFRLVYNLQLELRRKSSTKMA